GLDAPALLGVERQGEEVHLLLEDVEGRTDAELRLDDLAAAARALGTSQGRSDLPRPPWLSRRFLRRYPDSKPVDRALVEDDAAWAHPLIRRHVPEAVRQEALWVRREKAALLDAAEQLPRTVCHLDVWPS